MSAESLRVATYNVHGCVGLDGLRSEARIAEVIAGLDVDVIGLQELDVSRRRSGGVDQAAVIAQCLGWGAHFHPAMRWLEEEQYGDAVLSRFPMTLRRAGALPGGAPFYCRETRGALVVEVAAPGGSFRLINTHFGLGRRERLIQAGALAGPEWAGAAEAGQGLVVLGDFNSGPGSPPYRRLTSELRDVRECVRPGPALRTFPTRWPLVAVDHILVNDRWAVRDVRVVREGAARVASDHLPLVATLARREGVGMD